MWIILALCSAAGLGIYDIMKKLSLKDNNVLMVLMLNTMFGLLLMTPVIVLSLAKGESQLAFTLSGHLHIILKSIIVLASWLLGYFAIKHLPLTVQGPINASRPIMVLAGAVIIYGERLNLTQWAGIIIGFMSLFLISRIGKREQTGNQSTKWMLMAIGAAILGAISGLYDKYLTAIYKPLDVQAWYSLYQCIIMTLTIAILSQLHRQHSQADRFRWRWTIPLISVFLTAADIAYFYSLSLDGSLIAIVSMIRRGSVLIPFIFGVTVLREKNVRQKSFDLALLLVSLTLIIVGSAR